MVKKKKETVEHNRKRNTIETIDSNVLSMWPMCLCGEKKEKHNRHNRKRNTIDTIDSNVLSNVAYVPSVVKEKKKHNRHNRHNRF